MERYLFSLCLISLLIGCGANNTPPQVASPGKPLSPGLKFLNSGAALLQSRPPVDAMSAYLDGFHFYNGDKNGQMEAHHYVTVLNEEVMQAVIYDGNTRGARLMGVEYIISERLFQRLPLEEKKLWHSHQYEVKSGTLIAPGLPVPAEKGLMAKIVNTYGKTWHTWHTDRNKTLPLGIPALMMGFTDDGQLDPHLLADRDRRFGPRHGKNPPATPRYHRSSRTGGGERLGKRADHPVAKGQRRGRTGARNERFFGVGTDPRRKISLRRRASGKPPGRDLFCPETERLCSRGAPTAFISRRLSLEGGRPSPPP